jgi:hypothetical protein
MVHLLPPMDVCKDILWHSYYKQEDVLAHNYHTTTETPVMYCLGSIANIGKQHGCNKQGTKEEE